MRLPRKNELRRFVGYLWFLDIYDSRLFDKPSWPEQNIDRGSNNERKRVECVKERLRRSEIALEALSELSNSVAGPYLARV